MLDKPRAGWSEITLGTWSDRCSYLDDVPVMLLDMLIDAILLNEPSVATFDAEGYEYTILINNVNSPENCEIHIISDKGDSESLFTLTSIEMNLFDIAVQLASDVECAIDEWVAWGEVEPGLENEMRRYNILSKCKTLEYIAKVGVTHGLPR